MITGSIVSVQVGQPQKLTTVTGREWESAIVKTPVDGPVPVGRENLSGDWQANRRYHGGPDKAVCCYSAEHYPYWRETLGLDLSPGAFGENLTLADLTEDRICIGDTLAIGDVRLQVTQPRQPCVNLSKRWGTPRLPRLMESTGFTGFYCRVLQLGDLTSGAEIRVVECPYPEWNLHRANRTMYDAVPNRDEITALRSLPLLSAEWKRMLGRKLNKIAGNGV